MSVVVTVTQLAPAALRMQGSIDPEREPAFRHSGATAGHLFGMPEPANRQEDQGRDALRPKERRNRDGVEEKQSPILLGTVTDGWNTTDPTLRAAISAVQTGLDRVHTRPHMN